MTDIRLGVQTKTEKAKQDFSELVSAINEVKTAIEGLKSSTGLEKVKQSAKSAADEVKKTKPTFSEFKAALKGMDFPLKNFGKSLLRIAKLRLLRGIIRSITGAFKEGLSNIYQYSAAMNNMDASHMKGSMDSLASSLLYMKNAVASAVAPLIAQLVPVIAQVANWFVTAASAVAQFFAALGGATTYTRAKKEAVEWGNVASGAGGAAAAAQEYKNTILGFDEIHALNDVPSNGGGGGGGGGASPDFSNMFEEMPISQKVKDLVQWLKDNWNEIWSIVRHIGEALLAWKIGQSVIDFFNKLGLGGAANVAKIAMGLAISVVGIDLAYEGGYSAGYNGFSLMNIIQTVLGYGVAAIGGAIAFGPAGAIVTFGIALVGSIIGFQIGEREKHLDETYRLTEGYADMLATVDLANKILSHNITITTVAKDAMSEYSDTLAKIRMAEVLIPQIQALSEQIDDSGYKTEKLNFLIETLNGLGLEGVSAQFDTETGKVEMNTDAIYDNIASLKERAKQAALQKVLQTAYEEQARALIDNQIATDNLNHADSELLKATQALNEYEQGVRNGTIQESKDRYDELQQAVWDWQDAENAAYKAVEKTDSDLKTINKTTEQTEKAFDNLTGATKDTRQGFVDISNSASYTSGQINGVGTAVTNTGKIYFDTSKITGGFKAVRDWCQETNTKLRDTKWWIDQLNSTEIKIRGNVVNGGSGGGHWTRYENGGFVPGFANGGYIPSYATGGINSASLFMARENGLPEMVGQIGGHTAVANNGQIVEAVSRGVANAVSMVMGNGSNGNVEVNVTLDGQRIARAVDNANRVRNRRFNVQA